MISCFSIYIFPFFLVIRILIEFRDTVFLEKVISQAPLPGGIGQEAQSAQWDKHGKFITFYFKGSCLLRKGGLAHRASMPPVFKQAPLITPLSLWIIYTLCQLPFQKISSLINLYFNFPVSLLSSILNTFQLIFHPGTLPKPFSQSLVPSICPTVAVPQPSYSGSRPPSSTTSLMSFLWDSTFSSVVLQVFHCLIFVLCPGSSWNFWTLYVGVVRHLGVGTPLSSHSPLGQLQYQFCNMPSVHWELPEFYLWPRLLHWDLNSQTLGISIWISNTQLKLNKFKTELINSLNPVPSLS